MALKNIPKDLVVTYANAGSNCNEVKSYMKDLFRNRIFLGRYIERRLVDNVGYRDVVVISDAEVKLKTDLLEAKRKVAALNSALWVGITDTIDLGLSRSGVCIWTEIDYEPFGPFWFQIKTIKFRDNEVIVKVNCVRHITDAFLELEPLLTKGIKVEENNTSESLSNLESLQNFVVFLKSILKLRNIIDVITFMIAFITLVFTGGVEFVYFLGNFVLALFRESSILVKNATPAFLGLIDVFSKIVGGFYLLLAMILRQPPVPVSNQREIKYTNHRQNSYGREFD